MTRIIAVGASGAGGLRDLQVFLRSLPQLIDAAVLIVLHRPPDQPSWLQEILGGATEMPVEIARRVAALKPRTCYIGEPAAHLRLISTRVAKLVSHLPCHRNRTIDLLFESVAENARVSSIGVILSGALDDGARGLAAIHKNGGTTMVRRTGTRWRELEDEMPENARKYNEPVDVVSTVEGIAQAIAVRSG